MKPADIHTGLTAERLRELLSYDPETGILRWKMPRQRVVAGMVAGYKASTGYIQLKVDLHSYLAHRLVWLYVYGEWPAEDIDHVNGQRDDNRIANLRDVSRQVNAQNRHEARRPTAPSPFNTGLLGTHFCQKRRVFVAQITDPITGKRKNLGLYPTAEKAHQAYLEAKRRMHEGCTI